MLLQKKYIEKECRNPTETYTGRHGAVSIVTKNTLYPGRSCSGDIVIPSEVGGGTITKNTSFLEGIFEVSLGEGCVEMYRQIPA